MLLLLESVLLLFKLDVSFRNRSISELVLVHEEIIGARWIRCLANHRLLTVIFWRRDRTFLLSSLEKLVLHIEKLCISYLLFGLFLNLFEDLGVQLFLKQFRIIYQPMILFLAIGNLCRRLVVILLHKNVIIVLSTLFSLLDKLFSVCCFSTEMIKKMVSFIGSMHFWTSQYRAKDSNKGSLFQRLFCMTKFSRLMERDLPSGLHFRDWGFNKKFGGGFEVKSLIFICYFKLELIWINFDRNGKRLGILSVWNTNGEFWIYKFKFYLST